MLKGLFRFFSSVKLAVFSLLLLSAVLAYATMMGSFYGMRGSQVAVYQRWWFGGVLFLLGLNVFCAAMSRYPWKLRQAGFVLTHLGIIIILVGAFVTQKYGIDGNLQVSEMQQNREVMLNDLKLTIVKQATDSEESTKKQEIIIPESHVPREGKIVEIVFKDKSEKSAGTLVVEKFIPRAVPENQMIMSPTKGLGTPALKIALSNNRFRIQEWLKADPQEKKAELNLGPAIVTFQKLWTPEDEKNFWSQKPKKPEAAKVADKGTLLVDVAGQRFALKVSDLINQWRPLEKSGFEIRVDRYLPYAVVENNKLISRSADPRNPATEVSVRKGKDSNQTERFILFALMPEHNTQYKRKDESKPRFEVALSLMPPQQEQELMGVGRSRGRLYLAQNSSDSELFYRSFGASGDLNSEGKIAPGKKVPTGWMNIELEVKEWLPFSVQKEEPRSVEKLQGADEPFLTAIKVKVDSYPSVWLLEGMGKMFSVGGKDVVVQYHRDSLMLPFDIYLDKFTMGTNPGTQQAASFTSNVTVKDPNQDEQKKAVISMNEPLKYGGYYFYQASYQLTPGEPAVSVLAVNFDPGRVLKYLGSLIMTLGISLMFYLNPHYLKVFLGGQKETA